MAELQRIAAKSDLVFERFKWKIISYFYGNHHWICPSLSKKSDIAELRVVKIVFQIRSVGNDLKIWLKLHSEESLNEETCDSLDNASQCRKVFSYPRMTRSQRKKYRPPASPCVLVRAHDAGWAGWALAPSIIYQSNWLSSFYSSQISSKKVQTSN